MSFKQDQLQFFCGIEKKEQNDDNIEDFSLGSMHNLLLKMEFHQSFDHL